VVGCLQREEDDGPGVWLVTMLLFFCRFMVMFGEKVIGSECSLGTRGSLGVPDAGGWELASSRLLPRSEGSEGHLHDNAVAVEVGLDLGGGSLSGRHVDGWGLLEKRK